MYGDQIPPHKHINKIANKYFRYFLNDKKIEGFNDEEYFEIRIEERYIGLDTRLWQFPPVVSVKYEYLTKFINIFKSFNSNICLCKDNHEHPSTLISGIKYEGYCYHMKYEEKKILFIEDYGIENNLVSLDDLYEIYSNESTFNVNNLDRNILLPKDKLYRIENLEWYRNLPVEKRFKIVDVNAETEVAFEQWLEEIVQPNILNEC